MAARFRFARSIFTIRHFSSTSSKQPPPLPLFSLSTTTTSPHSSLKFTIPGGPTTLRSTSMTYYSTFRDADADADADFDNTLQTTGVDFKHWQILFRKPNVSGATNEDYVKTLGKVLGSEDEAKKKIYSVSFDEYFGFGAEVDEEVAEKLKDVDFVLSVLPDVSAAKKAKNSGGGKGNEDDPVWGEFLQMIYKAYVKILEGKQ